LKTNGINRMRIRRGSFASNVLMMMTGTAMAQAVPLLISPILTRLYRPEDFGVLALYMAITSVLSVIAAGRYELAVILPEKEDDAVNIMILALFLSLIIGSALCILVIVFNGELTSFFGNKEISFWLYFVPASVSVTGVYNTFYYWSTRKLQYRQLVLSKISQTTSMGAVNLLMGFKGFGASGLVTGGIAGQITSAGVMGFQIWKEDKGKSRFCNAEGMKNQLRRYKNFPLYSIPAGLMNVLSNQIPIYVLSIYFGGAVVGFFALTQRVLGAPISLISASILDVFKQRASNDYVTYGNCRDIFIKALVGLLVVSIIPFALFYYGAPKIFEIIFGKDWIIAGEYAQILTIMFFFRFIASPLSFVIYIAEKQKYDLIWQSLLFGATVVSMFAGVYLNNVKIALLCFSLSYSALYVIYLFISYYLSKGNKPIAV
jgi:O-antigen/teichoic acid export membrane protein